MQESLQNYVFTSGKKGKCEEAWYLLSCQDYYHGSHSYLWNVPKGHVNCSSKVRTFSCQSLLSAKPQVACQLLRPMVENYVSGWTGIPVQYITNFHKRLLLFLIKNPNYEHLTYDQAVSLASKKSMSADEMTELDDPFVLQNFTAMLQKTMQEDCGTWEGLGLMDELKITSPGFDYCIKRTKKVGSRVLCI
jgi:hypothetical protein